MSTKGISGADVKIAMEVTDFYQNIYETIEAGGFDVALSHPLKLKDLTAGMESVSTK